MVEYFAKQFGQKIQRGDNQHTSANRVGISSHNIVHQVVAHTFDRKDLFHYGASSNQIAYILAEQGDDGRQGIAEYLLPEDPVYRHPVGTGKAHIITVHFFQQ